MSEPSDQDAVRDMASSESTDAWQHQQMEGVTKVDWVLYLLTLYPSTLLLQFANTPFAKVINRPRPRRMAMLLLLVVEFAVIGFLVWRFVL